jgi:hypothetical protein
MDARNGFHKTTDMNRRRRSDTRQRSDTEADKKSGGIIRETMPPLPGRI